MRNKQARQAGIRDLLQAEAIETHEMLAQALGRRHIQVSQSTLSKDLRELGVVRVPRPDGGFRYTLPESGATIRDRQILERELRDFLVSVERAQNLIVAKTLSGRAQSVCEAIDRIGWSEIMGTLAGENTILIVSADPEQAAAVVAKMARVRGEAA